MILFLVDFPSFLMRFGYKNHLLLYGYLG
uniref:Uncharacterized protein n=1 Tax=Rhizophora mucronata TaxID=61149 RepID=A0A2P2NXQ4_RHIMU